MNIHIASWAVDLIASAGALLGALLLLAVALEVWMFLLDRGLRIIGLSGEVVAFALSRQRKGNGMYMALLRWLNPRKYWRMKKEAPHA